MSTAGRSNWRLCEFAAHSSNVNCLALTPTNGRMLATGGDDRRINLWIVGQPNCLMSISGITSPVQRVVFNNTENWVGAGSKSGVIKVFDLDENKTVRSISGHKAAVSSLDFHRYGDILASGSMDTNVKLWDVRRKGCIFTYKGHLDMIHSIQFSPDGKWVISTSEDGTVKLWDLSAGKMIAEFKDHTAGVTSVQFHPKEFLLATGSADRTAIVWDLERFEAVSVCGPESTSVRCVEFHPDGNALFTGAQDSLRTYTWEPTVVQDKLPVHWGRVADMAISGEQLIGASFSQTNVSLWCIDLKRVRPFSGDPGSPIEKAAPALSASGRRHFEFRQEEVEVKRPFTQASGQPLQRPPSEEGEEGEGGGGGDGVREKDSPPVEVRDEERKEIFARRQKLSEKVMTVLMRTPPKNQSISPFCPPPSTDTTSGPPKQLNGVQHVGTERGGGREGERKREGEGGRKRKGGRKKEVGARNNVVKDFVSKSKPPPKPQAPPSQQSLEKMLQRDIHTNHADVCSILESRLQIMREVRSQWSTSNPKASVEAAINSGNQSTVVDLLNVLLLKITLWNLDIAVLVLPELKLLLKSKYDTYVRCGCDVVKLVLKNFGPVIKTNLSTPPGQGGRGVDITKEERYEKCHTCFSHLVVLREEVERVAREAGRAAKVVRESAVVDSFSVLD